MRPILLTIVSALILGWGMSAAALEQLTIQQDGQRRQVTGKALVEAADGGLLVLDREGVIWALQPEEIEKRTTDSTEYIPLTRDELARQLQAEMPDGFRLHHTTHYLICYNTSSVYAEWCGGLYERLYAAFTNYWKHRGITPQEPQWPLVALVFSDKATYARYAQSELGDVTSSVIGYFSLKTNRVAMYDLTGVDGAVGPKRSVTTAAHVNRILSRPEAEPTVATIIHEATHQVAYNCGLHARFADIPLWVAEGIAVYFETPDLSSTKGWKNIGGVNQMRLRDFRRYAPRRPSDSLNTLIASDDRFRNSRTALDAYGEAWALNYFLLRKHPKEYSQYIRELSERKPLVYDSPTQRLARFQTAFGDLAKLDAEFIKFMRDGK